ncbi:MAG: terminase small subunit, partial [Proteobacteria bacterium]|nr:terminase small subunit [Pseudomonadota bacterium]
YSARTAEQQGPRLLGNVGVQAAIQEAQEARSEETGTTAAWVLDELKKVYEASMERNDKGVCANPAAANRALELLGKHLGMFKDAAPVNVNVNLPGDESSFADRLAAQRKQRANAKLRLVPSTD